MGGDLWAPRFTGGPQSTSGVVRRSSQALAALEHIREPRERGCQFAGRLRWRQRDLERRSAACRVALDPWVGYVIVVSRGKSAQQLAAETRKRRPGIIRGRRRDR